MMKFKLLLAPVSVVFLLSCTIGPKVWLDTAPEETLTTLTFSGIIPRSYNGISVEKWRSVKIPAGIAGIECDVDSHLDSSNYRARNKTFSYHFEAGKSYFVVFSVTNGYWGVDIYNRPPNSFLAQKKNLLDFVRFK
jgi:hypothetical protein